LDFAPSKKEFVSAANETNIKYWNIQETSSLFTIHGAHTDNIKKVKFISDNLIVSGSADKTLKLWDIRNVGSPLSILKLNNSVEDFLEYANGKFVVANGSALTLLHLDASNNFKIVNEYFPFQRPIMRIKYDKTRQRIMAGGLDGQLKFFEIQDEELKVAYKIKVPSEIYAFDVSSDGNHYSMGLNDGSLIIKSKLIEDIAEEDEE